MAEKIITGYIIANWKTGAIRAIKRKPGKTSPYDIPVKVTLKVKTPEQKEFEAKGEVTISESKMDDILIEEI